jgi:sugar phosphate isomerase/epimerase
MNITTRREFLGSMACSAVLSGVATGHAAEPAKAKSPARMRLGLVTYNWGRSWDLPTVIANCEAAKFEGVELRSTHKHGVEISMSKSQRAEVAKRFADSPVELAGLGSACEYHATDPAIVNKNIEETKAFVKLCHDVGGGGVKVRPNGLPGGVPVEKTLEQIGKSLNEVAKFGQEFGVEIRLEVHGRGTSELPHVKTIMDVADHKNAVVCWNCNRQDLAGKGFEHNFNLVKDRIGTIHIHDLRNNNYPWKELFALLKQNQFAGWTLIEDGRVPREIVKAMIENRAVWQELVSTA